MKNEHIVHAYDKDLGRLESLIAEMGGLAEHQLADAAEALAKRDVQLARRVIETDARIDALEKQVDDFTIRALALRQPMADDLRAIIVALKVAANLERIGDYAKNIAKRTLTLSTMDPVGNAAASVQRMSRQVQGMIQGVLDAYAQGDIAKADDVRLRDEEVDLMHTSLFRELLTYMLEDPHNITACTHLLFVAKNVERIGDHVTSIAEAVHFQVAGEMPAEERPKSDMTSTMGLEDD
ncbi:MAG: phosphate signaling complex protein PhoU [Alphaproteobacteria bacterium]|nr:phosphate signaling complex protein PhoU [Alphaproteobacteria bacterium]MBF0250421.1 phosphate signaling complex protein PhoU [Alphaproteobacteria bacterium]